jgi:hypothetical protein
LRPPRTERSLKMLCTISLNDRNLMLMSHTFLEWQQSRFWVRKRSNDDRSGLGFSSPVSAERGKVATICVQVTASVPNHDNMCGQASWILRPGTIKLCFEAGSMLQNKQLNHTAIQNINIHNEWFLSVRFQSIGIGVRIKVLAPCWYDYCQSFSKWDNHHWADHSPMMHHLISSITGKTPSNPNTIVHTIWFVNLGYKISAGVSDWIVVNLICALPINGNHNRIINNWIRAFVLRLNRTRSVRLRYLHALRPLVLRSSDALHTRWWKGDL